jgi:hypothetical protein
MAESKSKASSKSGGPPVLKWLFIGFMLAVLLGLIVTGLIIFKFTPVIEIDENHQRIQIFGGLIDINGDEGLIDFGKDILKPATGHSEVGTLAIDRSRIHVLKIPFNNGTMTFKTSPDKKLAWSCRVAGMKKRFHLISELGDTVVMNLDHSAGAECTISIPQGLSVAIDGGNAKVNVEKPLFNVNLKVANAKVGLSPVEGQAYKYDIKVAVGKSDPFTDSAGAPVYSITINIENGVVNKY